MLRADVTRSRARWKVIAQQLLIAELEHQPYGDELYWNDAWDGYPQARKRLLGARELTFVVEDGVPGAQRA